MKKLSVDLEQLGMAMEDASGMAEYYLNTETGEVIMISDETRHTLEPLLREAYDPETGEVKPIEEIVAQADIPDWQHDGLIEAYQVKEGYGERYITVPRGDSRPGYRDMQAFIETVEDDELNELLWRAISGRGAFRYFKDVLYDSPTERQRWFAFKNERLNDRVVHWLEEEGIESV